MLRIASLVALGALAAACQSNGAAAPERPDTVACTDPRPQYCTKDYRPVCGTRHTGVECVTTPCDSTEPKTYGNGCTACADPRVSSFVPGPCEHEPPAKGGAAAP